MSEPVFIDTPARALGPLYRPPDWSGTLADLIGPTVLLSVVSDHVTLAVPQALIDDTPAFAAYLERASSPDEVRSLMQGFARAHGSGCPWGEPAGCRCANCYREGSEQ
jgi:hypothetical protein